MASATTTVDPCVDVGTSLCKELEQCLTDIIIRQPSGACEMGMSVSSNNGGVIEDAHANYSRLQRIIEDLYSLLHYHVVALTGKAQCLQVEGILYRHLQLVSCRVIAAYLREQKAREMKEAADAVAAAANKASTTSDAASVVDPRMALLSGGLDDLLGGGALGGKKEVKQPMKKATIPPPTAILVSWVASLLPDTDNSRCYAPTGSTMVTYTAPNNQQQSLPLQLRRLLQEAMAGTTLSATMTSSHPSAAYYTIASVAGTNGVTDAARKFAQNTLRPIVLSTPAPPAAAGPKPATPAPQQQNTNVRGRGTQQAPAAVSTPVTSAPSTAGANASGGLPDTVFVYVPRMGLPVYHSHFLPARGGTDEVTLTAAPATATAPAMTVTAPSGLLTPHYYSDYSRRVGMALTTSGAPDVNDSVVAASTDVTMRRADGQQQVLFELTKDQRLERANARQQQQLAQQQQRGGRGSSTNSTIETVSIASYQRHWRKSDPFAAVRNAAIRYEDACSAAEEEAEEHNEAIVCGKPTTAGNTAASLLTRLGRKRSRAAEHTFGLLVSDEWLGNTLDDMLATAAFADDDVGNDGNAKSLADLVEEFVAAATTTGSDDATGKAALYDFFTAVERSKAVQEVAACRDPVKVVRFSRSMLYTPAVVRPLAAASSGDTGLSMDGGSSNTVPRSNTVPLQPQSADRLWALTKLFYSRRAPDEGNASTTAAAHPTATTSVDVPQLPIEPRAVMPVVHRVSKEDDMFSALNAVDQSAASATATAAIITSSIGAEQKDADNASNASGGDDDSDNASDGGSQSGSDDDNDDAVPPPANMASAPSAMAQILPHNRMTLTERVGIEFALRNRILGK